MERLTAEMYNRLSYNLSAASLCGDGSVDKGLHYRQDNPLVACQLKKFVDITLL